MLKVENSVGVLVIEDSAIQGVVAKAAEKCFGVAGMIPKNATEEIRAFFDKNFEKGIRVTCVDNEIFIGNPYNGDLRYKYPRNNGEYRA